MKFSSKFRGIPFMYTTYVLDPKEYAKIISEINTNYALYADKLLCAHLSVGSDNIYYRYYFENHGYSEYNIYAKVKF